MRAMDKVIGYDSIKEELYRIIDVLKNPDKYSKMGVMEPKGLMLIGDPGIGKSLLAECFMEEIGRKIFVIRKTRSDGDFINYIKNTFDEAKKSAPSIILIDDLDRFENGDKNKANGEAYIAVQSLIDEIKNDKVYVIATVNDEWLLPDSLCRDGRFDKKIYMRVPESNDSAKIFEHYLKNLSCVGEVNSEFVAKVLNGRSCATLKNVVNEAGIRAAYHNKDKIDMDDIVSACLRVIYKAPESNNNIDINSLMETSYHEAGHAIIKEILEPGSVNLVSILQCDGETGGITSASNGDSYYKDIDMLENDIITSFGGRAAIELKYGKTDIGSSSDIRRAYDKVERIVKEYCGLSFSSRAETYDHNQYGMENQTREISFKMQEYYNKAKRILAEHSDLLDKMAHLLIEKTTITYIDIEELMKCNKTG